MRFGLFGGASRSAGRSGDSEGYAEFIDMVVESEQLGFDAVFLVEHHFTGFGQVSASLNLLTYLAARTSTMRLGTAVTVLPWHNPVLLAEQAATVDLLSGGRLDLGVGRGYRPNEFHGFCVDPQEAEARYEECLQLLVQSWTSTERFSHHGQFWDFRDVIVEPQPVQSPHPPIWTGAGSERSVRDAARRNFRLLLDQFGSTEQTRQRIAWYRDSLDQAGLPFDASRIALARGLLLVAEADDETMEKEFANRMAVVRKLRESSRIPGDDTDLTAADHAFYDDTLRAARASAIAGTPDDCIERLLELKEAGVETVIFSGGDIDRLRFFAKEVMPALQ